MASLVNIYPIIKHAGKVIIHAASISNAVCVFRAESTKPQPMTDDVFACVVLTGSPRHVDKKRLILPAISAHTPCFKSKFTIFLPTVRMILPPPNAVPHAMVSEQISAVHIGI